MAASFKLFERCLDLNAWNKNMSTLSVSVQFNRCVLDSQWTMMLLSQDVSFRRHFKPEVLQLDSCSDNSSCPGTTHNFFYAFYPLPLLTNIIFYFLFLWKCRKNSPIIKHDKWHWTKLNLKGFVARQTLHSRQTFSFTCCMLTVSWHEIKQQNPGQEGWGITMIFKPIFPDFTNQRPSKKKCCKIFEIHLCMRTLRHYLITLV